MRVRRILLDEHSERIRRDKCPKCNIFPLQKLEVKYQQQLPKTKYKLIDHFWACAGPDSFNCYFISSTSGDTVFESSEGVSIIDFNEEKQINHKVGKIVKRLKTGQMVDITHLNYGNLKIS